MTPYEKLSETIIETLLDCSGTLEGFIRFLRSEVEAQHHRVSTNPEDYSPEELDRYDRLIERFRSEPKPQVGSVKNKTVLKDALYSLLPHTGASAEYCQGIVIGVVAMLMAVGETFESAVNIAVDHFPSENVRLECIPQPWKDAFNKYLI